jgi:hypothetical protein
MPNRQMVHDFEILYHLEQNISISEKSATTMSLKERLAVSDFMHTKKQIPVFKTWNSLKL